MSRFGLSSMAVMAALFAAPLVAQEPVNMAGKWEFSYSTQRGPTTFTVTFEQDGMTLTGKAEMQGGRGGGTFDISKGMVHGNEFTFAVVRTFGDNSFEQTFNGTVEGDTARGTMSGGGRRGGGQPIEWTAKKVPPGAGQR